MNSTRIGPASDSGGSADFSTCSFPGCSVLMGVAVVI